MTFPSGAPGGFPGQGPQQPHQHFPGAGPSAGGPKLGLPQILFLATAGLGVLNLFLGFANVGGGASFYEQASFAWIPALLFLSGLAAAQVVLPNAGKPGVWPALLAVGVVLPYLFVTFSIDGDYDAGGIMVLIFGILQMLAAIAAYLFDANLIKPPAAPRPQQSFGQPGPYGQQPGGFGQQPQQPYGPPAPDQSGGIPQPTKFAQPVNPQQQPTTYASQHGQFFQQQSPEGGQSPQQGGQPNS
ncbi:DUF5336 domain-containing protein [Prauserella oleivorans]|uniref:DUF5336 domain-containing protein n=1 Tax=Prauserella oleivorans TaxID=1478153 RepID=A0ABW5WBR8_9PSEU